MAELSANDEEFTLETREASPAHLLIKIESFSLLSKQGIEKYESREFEAGDYKWRLVIHPDGLKKSEDEDDHISVFLTIVDTGSLPVGWEVNAIFNIFLYSQILDNYLCFRGQMRRFHAMKSQWGFSKLISKKSLRDPCDGFLVDDTCVFGAEVFVIKSQRVTERVSVLEAAYPCKRDWKISEFFKLKEDWTSEEFSAGDHKWMVKLYPNGNNGEEGRSVSVYLHLVNAERFGPNEKVKADYCLRIKNQLNDQHNSRDGSAWFTSASSGWGWSTFIPLSDMRDPNKGFVVKDFCFLEIELSVKAVVRDAS